MNTQQMVNRVSGITTSMANGHISACYALLNEVPLTPNHVSSDPTENIKQNKDLIEAAENGSVITLSCVTVTTNHASLFIETYLKEEGQWVEVASRALM